MVRETHSPVQDMLLTTNSQIDCIRHLYPFRDNYLSVGEQRMHYVDEGSGPPILMLHCNPTWSFYYRELIKALSGDYRVIAPDHLGCGLSEKPQNYPYRLENHIDNLERLVDRLDLREPVTLAVHDWGGAIGCGLAVRRPELIRRFVLFNTSAFFGDVPYRIKVCKYPVLGTLAVRGFNAFARGAVTLACKNRERMTRDVREGYLLPYRTFRGRIAIQRFIQDIPEKPTHPTYRLIQHIDAGLAQFRGRPMVIFWGQKDFCFTEKFLNGWMERFPGSEVHIFEDAGHYVVEDAHERILPLLRTFLERT